MYYKYTESGYEYYDVELNSESSRQTTAWMYLLNRNNTYDLKFEKENDYVLSFSSDKESLEYIDSEIKEFENLSKEVARHMTWWTGAYHYINGSTYSLKKGIMSCKNWDIDSIEEQELDAIILDTCEKAGYEVDDENRVIGDDFGEHYNWFDIDDVAVMIQILDQVEIL